MRIEKLNKDKIKVTLTTAELINLDRREKAFARFKRITYIFISYYGNDKGRNRF